MDTSMTALTKTIGEIGKAFEAFKEVNDERLKAIEGGDTHLGTGIQEKLGKIELDLTKLSKLRTAIEVEQKIQKERIEELESREKMPGKTVSDKRRNEYKSTFIDWIRHKGVSLDHENKLKELANQAYEAKDISIGVASSGGFAVPEEIAREIERLELRFSPVRRLVKIVQTGSSDYKELVNIRGTTAGWVGESTARANTTTSELRERTPTNGELYAYPQVSEWSLDDIFFNVEEWLSNEIAEAFAVQEGEAVINGDGSNKPTGMLNTTPVSTIDFASPLRDANTYQFVASLSTDPTSPVAPELVADSLIDVIYELNSAYRNGATWVMNSNTLGVVRKLKDGNGQYHWQPGLQLGQPDRLLGYPIETWEQMDDVATNAFPVGFGNFRRAYVLADRVGLRMTRDAVTRPGWVRFYVRRREGGTLLNNDALKFVRTTIA